MDWKQLLAYSTGAKEIGMKCLYCQGTMERGTAPFHIDRKGYHLILDTIPA